MTVKINTKNLAYADAEVLRSLAHQRGECVTVLLPATHPGAPEGDKLAILKSLMQGQGIGVDMSRRLEAAVEEHDLAGGGPGIVLFAHGHSVSVYQAKVAEAKLVAGDRLFLLPVLGNASLAHRFLILGLSKKLLRLLQFEDGQCRVLDLPAGMPASLEESRGVETSDMKMKNHAPGGVGSVRFGASAADEDQDRHLEHWFSRVDEAIAKMAIGEPVLLMGLKDEVAAFRRSAKRCLLLDTFIEHGIKDFSLGEIAHWAGECAQEVLSREALKALDRVREWKDRSLVVNDIVAVNQASIEGRVQVLCVGGERDQEVQVNVAVTETLCHGGEVVEVPSEVLSTGCPVVALLRD
jgi:hypothetical protein